MFALFADVVWPALLLSARLWAWWCIGLSVLIEAAALWRFAGMRPWTAIAGSAAMNLASAFCGTLLLPLAGLRWELFASLTFEPWFHWGTFNPINYIATWVAAVLLSTLIETSVLWLLFMMPWTRRLTAVVLIANAVTVSLASLTMILFGS